jgi:hypothetical protein
MFPSPASALPGILIALGISPLPPGTPILSFTDPIGTFDGWPRIYVEPDPPEFRLFTGSGPLSNGNLSGLTLIPSELAQALHFSLLTKAKRDTVRNECLAFILTQLVNGLPPHTTLVSSRIRWWHSLRLLTTFRTGFRNTPGQD